MKIINRHAAEVQQALGVLSGINLPIKISLRLAQLADEVERQVKACLKVRDTMLKNYQITVSRGQKEGQFQLTTSITGADSEETQKLKEAALIEFTNKVNELLDEEGAEITIRIPVLPDNIVVNSATLKALLPFMESA